MCDLGNIFCLLKTHHIIELILNHLPTTQSTTYVTTALFTPVGYSTGMVNSVGKNYSITMCEKSQELCILCVININTDCTVNKITFCMILHYSSVVAVM